MSVTMGTVSLCCEAHRSLRRLQTLVYDILPWRKVPESGARSVISALRWIYSNESHFDTVRLLVRGRVTRRCPQTTRAFEENGDHGRGIEPTRSAYQPNALPLGQADWLMKSHKRGDCASHES